MKKNTNSRTATTFNLPTAMSEFWDAEDVAELTKPYVWPSAEKAEASIDRMIRINGFMYVQYEVPGMTVFAVTDHGRVSTVIVIEDDTAARLHRAVRSARPVTVTYTKADGTETVRTIEPTTLALTKAGDVIVKAADRASGERRSFRLDRVSAYTVHRSRFTVRLEAPAPTKAELAEAFKAGTAPAVDAPRVQLEGRGWTGHLDLSTEAFGPSGWSAKVTLDPEFAHLAVSGSLRVGYGEIIHI